jgi:hypothetical protein
MPALRAQRWTVWVGIFAIALCTRVDQTEAQDGVNEADASAGRERPAHLVVVRISESLISSLINRTIDIEAPVRDFILDSTVRGAARLTGEPVVQLKPSEECARFTVVLTGTVQSRTTARNGPAVIHGHSVTHFKATKELVFEPGKGFRGDLPKVYAQTQCFTDDVRSTRGGILGRLVQRRAQNEVAASHDEVVDIVRDRAARRIAYAFESYMQERLARLNRALEFQTKLAELRSRDGNRRLIARTTPEYLEIADAIHENDAPIGLPLIADVAHGSGPIQIWVNSKIVHPAVAHALETIFTRPNDSAIVNTLALLPGTFGKEAAAAITAFAEKKNVGIQYTDNWFIVEVNTAPLATTHVAEATSDTIRR